MKKTTTLKRLLPLFFLLLSAQVHAQILVATSSGPTSTACSCDGFVIVTAQGGTTPYTYLWQPGGQTSPVVQGLCAGTYTVIVTDAQGLQATATATVTSPAPVVASAAGGNITNCSCNGTLTGSVSGGTGPYTFLWTPGNYTTAVVTNICTPGTYTLTVTDANGCTDTTTTTITSSGGNVVATAQSQPTQCGQCNGSMSGMAAGGTGPYTYLWQPGNYTTQYVANVCAGTYTFIVTDSVGCSATYVTTVAASSGPSVTITTTPSTPNCTGTATANVSGGTGPYTYTWCNNSTAQTIFNVCPGLVCVCVTDAQGCVSCDSNFVAPFTGIITNDLQDMLSLYPNPANTTISYQLSAEFAEDASVSVADLTGRVVFTEPARTKGTIAVTGWPQGVYFVHVESPAGKLTKKITVTK